MPEDRDAPESPFEEPTRILSESDPDKIARDTGAGWRPAGQGAGFWVLPVLNGEVSVRYPQVEIEAAKGLDSFSLKLLALIYLSHADGVRPSGNWIPYRELPGGRFYEPVVQRSVEQPLLEGFGDDPAAFASASLALGASPEEFGDESASFNLFPYVTICFVLWRADEEFQPRVQALFDSNCSHHLTAFDLRMGAQEISGLLLKVAGKK